MNLHELPMIIFTVFAQMSVGAFVALGVINVVGTPKYGRETIERVTDPAIYAIGPTLVFGLIASMFHMNDITNTLNVLRNWDTSWLSREIILGVGFAGLGFLFAIMQWFKIASHTIRQAIALLAAIVGLGLVYSMSMIYASVETIPAWNTWSVPVQFFATTFLLGALAVGAAILIHMSIRFRSSDNGTSAAPATDSTVDATDGDGKGGVGLLQKTKLQARSMTRERLTVDSPDTKAGVQIIRWVAITSVVVGVIIFINYIFHIINLATGVPEAQLAAEEYQSGFFFVRLALLGIAAVLLAVFTYRTANQEFKNPKTLTILMMTALVLAVVTEFMGRSVHYDTLFRVGM